MRLVGEPLLNSFPDKIINVHPADLGVLEQNPDPTDSCRLRRIYIGEDAVSMALRAGEARTRSSVIMVNSGVDNGEILTQGPWVDVREDFLKMGKAERDYVLKEVAEDHQYKQKEVSDWPALTTALKLISQGRIGLGTQRDFQKTWRKVYVDGEPMLYGGYQVE